MELHEVFSQEREITLGGKTFVCGKLTLRDQAALDKWINDQVDQEVRKIMQSCGVNDVASYMELKYKSDLYFRFAASSEATLFTLHRLVSKKNDISFDDFCNMVTVEDALKLQEQWGMVDDKPEADEGTDSKNVASIPAS